MFEIGTGIVSAGMIVTLGVLTIGIINLLGYWFERPEKPAAFDSIRTIERDHRSIVLPGVAALIAGLFVSMSASFLYEGLRHNKMLETNIGAALFIAATLTFIFLISPAFKGDPSIDELAEYPQRIHSAVLAVRDSAPDAPAVLAALESRLDGWESGSGAYSMRWNSKTPSPYMNAAFDKVPASRSLPMRRAIRSVPWPSAFVAAWRTAPWRFAWPAYLTLGLVIAGSILVLQSGVAARGAGRLILIFLAPAVVAILVAGASALLGGARRLAIQRAFVGACRNEIASASARIDAVRANELAAARLPAQLDRIATELHRIRRFGTAAASAVLAVSTITLAVPALRKVGSLRSR